MDSWKHSPKIAKDYSVLTVNEKFYNKWWMSCGKKLFSPTMDSNAKKTLCLAVKIVEDGALEAFEDVNLNNGT